MFFPFRPKPLFHDVQKEMLAEVKKQAFWPYAGLCASRMIFRISSFLSVSVFLAYVIIGVVMESTMHAGPAEIYQLAATLAPWLVALIAAVVLSQIFYEVLWKQLQPVVRAAVRAIQSQDALRRFPGLSRLTRRASIGKVGGAPIPITG